MTITHPLWRPFELPTQEQIDAARLRPHVPVTIAVVPPDRSWTASFARVRDLVVGALGDRALSVTHVGSTAVPGLWAKPTIDVDLTVPDSSREEDYVPALEAAGFELTIREPEWEQHRLLKLPEPLTHLHVFSPGAVEPQRHLAFRDWLASHPDDRERYAAAKRGVAARGFTDGMDYNREKSAVVYDIYERIFVADPEHPHEPQPRPAD